MTEIQKEAMRVLKELKIGLAVAQQSETYEPTRIGLILLKDIISIIGAQDAKIQALEEEIRELRGALESIAVPDGDIGTTIYKSELARCQGIAKTALRRNHD